MVDSQVATSTQPRGDERQSNNKYYGFMFLLVALNLLVTVAMFSLPFLWRFYHLVVAQGLFFFFRLMLLELLLVGYLTVVPTVSASAAGDVFLTCAILNLFGFSLVVQAFATGSIGETFIATLIDGLVRDRSFWPHIAATFKAVLVGLGIALVVGLPLGGLFGRTDYRRQTWKAILVATYAIPKISLYPLFILLFGVGSGSRAAMAFVQALVPTIINAMTNLAGGSVVSAVRTGITLAVVGVVLSEWVASTAGLGFLIGSTAAANVNRMLAILLLIFLVLVLVNVCLWALEKRLRSRREPDYTERQNL